MRFTKIRETAFEEIQLNAGVLVDTFNPESPAFETNAILGATSGGINFTATPTFKDNGEDIDNCPKNTKELKQLDDWEITMKGSFATATPELVQREVGIADVLENKITPRRILKNEDFKDLWWVGDYSDKNGEVNGGFIAIHMMNTLSTGGFSLQTTDREKGNFDFEFMAHYSIAAQDTVPFEIYVEKGNPEL